MHYTMRMTEIERLQDSVNVNTHIGVRETSCNDLGLSTWHVLVNEAWNLRARLLNHVAKVHNVGATVKCLQNLDLTENFLSLDRL